jgi:hypothetical protein
MPLERPTVTRDHLLGECEIPREDHSERLGVEPFGKSCRIAETGEDDRHELAHLADPLGRRRPLAESVRLGGQGRVLAQNRSLELAKCRSRLEAELFRQMLARCAVDVERLRLPPRSIERQHQLRGQPLAERLGTGEQLELADQLAVSAERKVGLDPLLERLKTQFLQTRDLALRERLVAEIGERLAAEERERVPQRL